MNEHVKIRIIGAGLAGCEAAFQAAKRGIDVELFEMKPAHRSPAHSSDSFCELCCSNSLRSDRLQNAAGLLKEELRRMGSLVMRIADKTSVPAGGALAVNRQEFSSRVTEELKATPNITVIEAKINDIAELLSNNSILIVATGPLTDGELMRSIERLMGEPLHFFDAAAPIVTRESLDFTKVFEGSRYDRGNDYLNCPMTRDEYLTFVDALVNAETAQLHSFEGSSVFEGCMPVEVMAKRGVMTLAYGPLKPVGLTFNGQRPFAVVQLRCEDKALRCYNLVGFQTNLLFNEQRRVFSLIPGLEHAEFTRLGVMHRNSFLNSPQKLDVSYAVKALNNLYFAGQLTGVEGYIESTASGLVCGINAARKAAGKSMLDFTSKTATGALAHYVSEYNGHDFQPQNINFGIMDELDVRIKDKQARCLAVSERALSVIDEICSFESANG